MTANRGCGWFPETSEQMTFRTPMLLLEPLAEQHLVFVQAEASKWEVAQRLKRAAPLSRRWCVVVYG